MVAELKERSVTPALEFTIDRRNAAALDLVKTVAGQTGMEMRKTAEPVQFLDEPCCEDLYTMTVARSTMQIFRMRL